MLVAVAADADVVILIRRNGDVVDGGFSRFFHGAELGVHQQAALIHRGGGDQGVADGAVVGLLVVLAAPEEDPGQAVLDVFAREAQIRRVHLHLFNDFIIFIGFAIPGFIGFLGDGGVLFVGHHIKEVFAHQLGVDAHEQGSFAFADEIPHVLVGLGAQVVEHEDLVQGLQGQGLGVIFAGDAFCIVPVQGNEVQQDAGVQHLALDLVAVLNQGHGEGVVGTVDILGQLIEDPVFLGLLPVEVQVVVRIDFLGRFDELRDGGLAAAGVANREIILAVGFFNGFLDELFQGHFLRLFDHILHGFGGGEGNHGQQHHQRQHSRNEFFHTRFSFYYIFGGHSRPEL